MNKGSMKRKRKKLIREAYKYMNDNIFKDFKENMLPKVTKGTMDFSIEMARTFGLKHNGRITKFV